MHAVGGNGIPFSSFEADGTATKERLDLTLTGGQVQGFVDSKIKFSAKIEAANGDDLWSVVLNFDVDPNFTDVIVVNGQVQHLTFPVGHDDQQEGGIIGIAASVNGLDKKTDSKRSNARRNT